METVNVGVTGFANEASREDDLGGGRIYAALIKQAVLKRLGQSDADVATEVDGTISVDVTKGAAGAVIADTSAMGNIKMQIVCPVGFKADLMARIASETGKTLTTCNVGEFLDAFAYAADNASVTAWAEFISWLNSQWRTQMNSIISSVTSATVTTIDGDTFSAAMTQMPALSVMSDLINWVISITPAALLAESVQVITSDLNPDKLGFTAHMTTSSWLYSKGSMHFFFRL